MAKVVKPKFRRFKAKRILLAHPDQELDAEAVSELAESFEVIGQVQPVVVCRAKTNGKSRKYELIAGAHRLKALRDADRRLVDCVVIEADDTTKRLVHITDNLFRRTITKLERAELIVEYVTLAGASMTRSGQVDQLPATRRSLTRAAQNLPLIGRTPEARRKILERALKIANMAPEAKQAAKEIGLDDNEQALLKIARAGDFKQQVRKVAVLAKVARKLRRKNSKFEKNGGVGAPIQSAKIAPSDASHNQNDTFDSGDKTHKTPTPDTTFEQLHDEWEQHMRKLWSYAPAETRQRFLRKLEAATCKAPTNVSAFVRRVMQGRSKLDRNALVGLAQLNGLSEKRVCRAARLAFRLKHRGKGTNSFWWYENYDDKLEMSVKAVSDAELHAASKKYEPIIRTRPPRAWAARGRDYYKDLN